MKRVRRFAMIAVCLVGGYFAIGAALFRLPVGPRVQVEGEVMWKMLDLGGYSLRHWTWEVWPWGGRNLFLIDGRVFQVSSRDDDRLWSESWAVLEKENRTKRVILSAYPVLLGGYGCARIEEIVGVQGPPFVCK